MNYANPGIAHNLIPRFENFKLRTTGFGIAAALASGLGLLLAVPQALDLIAALGNWSGTAAMPSVHIPTDLMKGAPDSIWRGELVLQLALLFVWVAGVWGWSNGRLEGLRRWVWFGIVVVLTVFTFYAQHANHPSFKLFPSKLEYAVRAKKWDQAERTALEAPEGRLRDYVQAQIALHAGDKQGLAKYAKPIIDDVDMATMLRDPGLSQMHLNRVNAYRPAVIYALEMALYNEPRTSVGIGVAERYDAKQSLAENPLRRLLKLTGSALLIILGGLGLWVWLGMSKRVKRLQTWVDQPNLYTHVQTT